MAYVLSLRIHMTIVARKARAVLNAFKSALREGSEGYGRCDIEHEIFSARNLRRPNQRSEQDVSGSRPEPSRSSTDGGQLMSRFRHWFNNR